MIPTLEQIEDDELFASWFEAMIEENGAVSKIDKERFLYSITGDAAYIRSQHKFRSDYMGSLTKICYAAKGSILFPTVEDILKKHTDLYAMMPFWEKGTQAKRFEHNLLDMDATDGIFTATLRQTPRKVCPLCAREDFKHHSRLVIHVPHMLSDVCWRHGCRLVKRSEWRDSLAYDDPEPATEQEMKKAVFMHDLYLNPAVTYFEQMRDALKESLDKDGISADEACRKAKEAGYLDPDLNTDRFLKAGYGSYDSDYVIYLSVLAWHYGTAEKFKADLTGWNPADEYTRKDMELLSCEGPLARFRCKTCGYEFYLHPVSAQYGTPCPSCRRKMTDTEIYKRYADHLDDGEYSISKDEDGRIHVFHKECGQECTGRFGRIVWSHIKCEKCRVKHEVESHIGERNENSMGYKMEITGGRTITDLDIRFDHGEEIHGRPYSSFTKGMIKSSLDSKLMKERVGDENTNKYGLRMKVKAYRRANDIDVEFDDGTVAEHRTYVDFQNGNIGYPKHKSIRLKEERLGEKKVNYQGVKMEITAYRNPYDIDVTFETGEAVHSKYEQFKNGKVKCPSAFRHQERVGEDGFNTQGDHMVIIRYGNAEDVDVQFDNGNVVHHKKYANFKSGKIGTLSMAEERLGEEGVNTNGQKMTIVGYVNNQNVDVGFENGYVAYGKTYAAFKKGLIACRKKQSQTDGDGSFCLDPFQE